MRRGFDQLPEIGSPGIEVYAVLEYVRHRGAEDAATLALALGGHVPPERFAPVLLAEEAPLGLLTPEMEPDAPATVSSRPRCRSRLHRTMEHGA